MPPENQDSQHSGYSQNAWMGVPNGIPNGYSSPQTTISPMQEFPQFDYHHHHTTPIPLEPAYPIQRPSPFASSHAPMPPPLVVPNNILWPSMLASQPQASYPPPILPAGPLQTPLSAGTGSDATPTSAKTNSSRRKLTDEERRQMCIEAEQNPSMKQTQIGAKFNVERSTVSKILRQRDKYMNPQPKEESVSPSKKSKAKLPDFEKTLTNWVRNQQKKGLPISDEDLRKQAQVFSFSRSDQAVVSSADWLEKFKRKNHLIAHKGDADSTLVDSSSTSLSQTPLDGSPASSNGLVSPPMSAIEEHAEEPMIKMESHTEFFDFGDGKPTFETQTELDRELTSESIMSPMSVEMVRNDQDGMAMLESADDALGGSNRQRSQTYPHAPNLGNASRPSSSGQNRPALPVRSLTTTTVAAAATGEPRPTAIDPRQMMKRHKSVPDIHYPEQVRFSSMQPPPLPRSADTSPISNPASPAEDDIIRALHATKALLEQNPTVAEPDDYLAIGKLIQKIKALRPTAPVLPGGMHPIDIMDSPRISKKRTILGIST
ncbi:uncharacterized protein Z519_03501 [Cladophialophora bantiana CBS 173.52]|uniref:HTH CENPB-type domain-containing protein n=1 Tax=Cladophialophora bantiana (strain ATCC 10958 / CBS 173.52 / CDC B-1940 / NIH 8579) TaxID=1442370 RepID=A0A0D2GDH0_CLAB1|nr:uncharacterized protein Z519_03501 [Cladophialophora bantiana CBS 173.52]KIW96432.1 hypothetical protein Z519_03501 [Cladophialophora bantiana CBS 173.52]